MSVSSDALRDARTITSSLRRARRSMEYGVLQADTAVSMLRKDGEIIKNTLDTHKYDLKNSLDSSKSRLKRVKNMQYFEKISLKVSVAFFALVVVYITAKRLRIFQVGYFIIKYGLPTKNHLYRIYDNKYLYKSIEKDSQFVYDYLVNLDSNISELTIGIDFNNKKENVCEDIVESNHRDHVTMVEFESNVDGSLIPITQSDDSNAEIVIDGQLVHHSKDIFSSRSKDSIVENNLHQNEQSDDNPEDTLESATLTLHDEKHDEAVKFDDLAIEIVNKMIIRAFDDNSDESFE